jgi:protein TonB
MRARDLLIFAATFLVSLVGHVGVLKGLGTAAALAPRERYRTVELAVLTPEPPPPPVEPEKPKPPPPKPVDLTQVPPQDPVTPPPNTEEKVTPPNEVKPVFGVTMQSVVGPGTGSGFRVRVGNTLMKDPEDEYTDPKELEKPPPVPLYKVTRQPKFRGGGPCTPPYPPEAKQLGIEGRVQLEVELRADGTVGEIKVVKGLGPKLDDAAIAAMRTCPFEPAEVAGQKVTTRITVGITFVIED